MSSTSTACSAQADNRAAVTPGRSRPVSVTSTVGPSYGAGAGGRVMAPARLRRPARRPSRRRPARAGRCGPAGRARPAARPPRRPTPRRRHRPWPGRTAPRTAGPTRPPAAARGPNHGGSGAPAVRRRACSPSAASGRQRATSRSASRADVSSRVSRSASVGLAEVRTVRRLQRLRGQPGHARPHHGGNQPEAGPRQQHRLAGLERLGVEGGRTAQPGQVARRRQGQRRGSCPRRRSMPSPRTSGTGSSCRPSRSCAASPPTTASRASSRLHAPAAQVVNQHANRADRGSSAVVSNVVSAVVSDTPPG